MRSWFDLPSLDLAGKEDEVGIKKAHQLVEMLIEEEVKAGIPSERIMLALYMQAKTGGRDCPLWLGTSPQTLFLLSMLSVKSLDMSTANTIIIILGVTSTMSSGRA